MASTERKCLINEDELRYGAIRAWTFLVDRGYHKLNGRPETPETKALNKAARHLFKAYEILRELPPDLRDVILFEERRESRY